MLRSIHYVVIGIERVSAPSEKTPLSPRPSAFSLLEICQEPVLYSVRWVQAAVADGMGCTDRRALAMLLWVCSYWTRSGLRWQVRRFPWAEEGPPGVHQGRVVFSSGFGKASRSRASRILAWSVTSCAKPIQLPRKRTRGLSARRRSVHRRT